MAPLATRAYTRFRSKQLDLEDHLSLDRTLLANERTLLSYFRTSLTMLVAGVSFIHFIDTGLLHVIGWVLLPLGIIILVIGVQRYQFMEKRIRMPRKGSSTNPDRLLT